MATIAVSVGERIVHWDLAEENAALVLQGLLSALGPAQGEGYTQVPAEKVEEILARVQGTYGKAGIARDHALLRAVGIEVSR